MGIVCDAFRSEAREACSHQRDHEGQEQGPASVPSKSEKAKQKDQVARQKEWGALCDCSSMVVVASRNPQHPNDSETVGTDTMQK